MPGVAAVCANETNGFRMAQFQGHALGGFFSVWESLLLEEAPHEVILAFDSALRVVKRIPAGHKWYANGVQEQTYVLQGLRRARAGGFGVLQSVWGADFNARRRVAAQTDTTQNRCRLCRLERGQDASGSCSLRPQSLAGNTGPCRGAHLVDPSQRRPSGTAGGARPDESDDR